MGIIFPSHEVVSSDPWPGSPDGGKESEGDVKGLESPALSRSSSILEGQQDLLADGVLPMKWFRRLGRFAGILSGPSTEGNIRNLNSGGYSGGVGGSGDGGFHRLGEFGGLRQFPARGVAPRVVEEASRASGPGAFGRKWQGRRLAEVVAAGADGELDVGREEREPAKTSRAVREGSKGSNEGGQGEYPRGLGSTEEKNHQKGRVVVVFGGEVAPEGAIMRESAEPEGKVSEDETMKEKNLEGVESEKAVFKEINSTEKAVPVVANPEEDGLEAKAVGINEDGMSEGDVSEKEAVPDEVKPESAGQEEATPQKEAVGKDTEPEVTTMVSGKDIESARQQDTAEGRERGEVGSVPNVVLAWIPGDPCSCIDNPGIVGQACRAWLSARAVSMLQISKVNVGGAGVGLG